MSPQPSTIHAPVAAHPVQRAHDRAPRTNVPLRALRRDSDRTSGRRAASQFRLRGPRPSSALPLLSLSFRSATAPRWPTSVHAPPLSGAGCGGGRSVHRAAQSSLIDRYISAASCDLSRPNECTSFSCSTVPSPRAHAACRHLCLHAPSRCLPALRRSAGRRAHQPLRWLGQECVDERQPKGRVHV